MRVTQLFVLLAILGLHFVITADQDTPITARLSGTTIVTTDMQKGIDFYVGILGYVETKIRSLKNESASLAVYGLGKNDSAMYTTLLPARWEEDGRKQSTINLIEVATLPTGSSDLNPERQPALSEVILAFRVQNIDEIHARAKASNIPIVTPLVASATGKSKTLTLLDPDGTRVHVYEYNP